MYCAAREAHARVCTVSLAGHPCQSIANSDDRYTLRHLRRSVGNGMKSEECPRTSQKRTSSTKQLRSVVIDGLFSFDNLIMRFEEPSSMVRWDSPLFTIPYNEDPPFKDIWKTITSGAKKPPTAAVIVVSTDSHLLR